MSRAVFIAALLCAAPAFAETRYFSALPDLPLPPGFTETQTAAGFDAAEGRLITADAVGAGAGAPERIRAFYIDSLPALGWSFSPTADGALLFLRGRERLAIAWSGDAAHTRLHVQLVMRPASMNAD